MDDTQKSQNTPPFDSEEKLCSEFSAFGRMRRKMSAWICSIPDSGWLGMIPLELHIHICGYSRSGTTLLQIMLEFAYPNSRYFGHEISGRRAIMHKLRNHKIMITKKPKDIFRLHQLINHYRDSKTSFKPIVMIRDPRDVLTSRHITTSKQRSYHMKLERWKAEQPFILYYMNHPDVLMIKYEELTGNTDQTQERIECFVEQKSERRFSDFHKKKRADFDDRHLNGVRPVDQKTIARWKAPEHIERICEIIKAAPGFAEDLITMGYETDTSWIKKYTPRSHRAATRKTKQYQ